MLPLVEIIAVIFDFCGQDLLKPEWSPVFCRLIITMPKSNGIISEIVFQFAQNIIDLYDMVGLVSLYKYQVLVGFD